MGVGDKRLKADTEFVAHCRFRGLAVSLEYRGALVAHAGLREAADLLGELFGGHTGPAKRDEPVCKSHTECLGGGYRPAILAALGDDVGGTQLRGDPLAVRVPAQGDDALGPSSLAPRTADNPTAAW